VGECGGDEALFRFLEIDSLGEGTREYASDDGEKAGVADLFGCLRS